MKDITRIASVTITDEHMFSFCIKEDQAIMCIERYNEF